MYSSCTAGLVVLARTVCAVVKCIVPLILQHGWLGDSKGIWPIGRRCPSSLRRFFSGDLAITSEKNPS